jgi:phage anti-repressor protein
MDNSKDSVFIELLKAHTNIDEDFIDTFFKKFKMGGELDFDIKDIDVAKFLGISLVTLKKRLTNAYSKTKKFIQKVDYIKIKTGKTSSTTYMLNYQCFEKLAMSGDSANSETVRMYFIKLREFISTNQHLIFQAIENKNELKKYEGFETIYFFAVDNKKMNWKVGKTGDIVQRLRNYNVGRIKEVDLKYLAIVKNQLLIEKCVKLELKDNQVIENREIYKTDAKTLKNIITECYCKYVSENQNKDLYEELANLLGIYAYTKDKTHIKPYVIIGKDI